MFWCWCIQGCPHVYTLTPMWVAICAHIYMCGNLHVHIHMYVSAYICTCTHMWVSMSIHTHGPSDRGSLCLPPWFKQPCDARLRRREAVCFPCRMLAETWPWKKQHKCTHREHLSNCLLRKRKEPEKRARKKEEEEKNKREGKLDPLEGSWIP